jgi:hypothetical protein
MVLSVLLVATTVYSETLGLELLRDVIITTVKPLFNAPEKMEYAQFPTTNNAMFLMESIQDGQ